MVEPKPPLIRWWAVMFGTFFLVLYLLADPKDFHFWPREAVVVSGPAYAEIEPPFPPKAQDRLWRSETDE